MSASEEELEGLGNIGGREAKEGEGALSAEVTAHSVPIKKRTPGMQLAWESDLAALLIKSREDYAKSISRAFLNTQPAGSLDLRYVTPESREAFLHQKYCVKVSSDGRVSIRPPETKEEAITAVYLGVMALQKISAVPIVHPDGGTVQDHINLLKACLSLDMSLPKKRLEEIAVGIRGYAHGASEEEKEEVGELLALSEANSDLHHKQQGYDKPLSKAERRAELEAYIREFPIPDDDEESIQEFRGKLLKRLDSVDATLASIGKEAVVPDRARTPSWTDRSPVASASSSSGDAVPTREFKA